MNDKVFAASKWERLVSEERQERQSVDKFLKIAEPKRDEVWADIGCGPGYFTLPIAKKVKKVLAVDVNEQMLNICKSRAADMNLENISYIKTDGKSFNIKTAAVDRILLVNTYHELPDDSKINSELNRILKNGGLLFVIDWRYEEMDFGPPLEHRIPEKTLIAELKSAGFSFVSNYDIYSDNYTLEFVKG